MLTRKLLSVIDNIIVDVFKIISESTDSFMVNVTVSLAQLPGVEFYLYPTVGTVLIHSVKPELTE